MNIVDILAIEGIVVRHIPKQTFSTWIYKEGQTLKDNQKIITGGHRKFVREWRENSLHGYIIMFQHNQSYQVHFRKNYFGFGDTIEAAYQDYLSKNKTGLIK